MSPLSLAKRSAFYPSSCLYSAPELSRSRWLATGKFLRCLMQGVLGPTQIGKFITVYPPSDAESRSLADELTAATQHFEGPEVITDLRLGRVVYARYGGFNADQERDRLGHVFSVLHDDAGASRRDERAVPFVPPRGVINPFADLVERQRISLNAPDKGKLFGPGYLLLDVIKRRATGSVFLALDMRDSDECCGEGDKRR